MEAALAPLERRIVTASSGAEALSRLLDEDFAVLLLDVQMPGMDGYDTAQLIRARGRNRHLPIIFVTAHSYDDDAVLRGYALGIVDFLFKPLRTEIVQAKVQGFLSLSDAQQSEQAHALAELRAAMESERLQREIAHEHAANEALRAANEQLAAEARRKAEFLAMLGHELRNPLAPIRTSIDLLTSRAEQPPEPRLLQIMDRHVGHLARLVDDLLDLGRITAGKLELRKQAANLYELVEEALAVCKPFASAKQQTIEVAYEAAAPIVEVDRTRIVQVVANLLTNAVRYTPNGGAIRVTCVADAEGAHVSVQDTGIGIAPDAIDRVFEMFVQEGASKESNGGLGVGLALAHQLASLHGGALTASSAGRNRGSTFQLSLPRAQRQSDADRDAVPLSKPERVMRAVVVDDDPDIRELVAELLAAHGHHVVTANDGASALEMICAEPPDVALIDLGLPGLDGFTLARAICERCTSPRPKLVAFSGFGQDSDRARAREGGFDVHLLKPATSSMLLSTLARLGAPAGR